MGVVKMKTAGFSENLSVKLHSATFENAVSASYDSVPTWNCNKSTNTFHCVVLLDAGFFRGDPVSLLVTSCEVFGRRSGAEAGLSLSFFWVSVLLNHHPTLNAHSSITTPRGSR
jgi:hypothetical protein